MRRTFDLPLKLSGVHQNCNSISTGNMSQFAELFPVTLDFKKEAIILDTQDTMKPTAINSASGKNSDKDLPEKLSADFTKYEKLTREQAGHLRYFHNIASAPDGEWPRMGSQDVGQEWLDGYRYQLATMVYASGLAHYHRLPALRSAFKALMKALIRKMLRREVWGYWYLTSQSGPLLDPSLTDLRKPWPDPVCEENIMVTLLFLCKMAVTQNADSL
jgi:hypothetical protein